MFHLPSFNFQESYKKIKGKTSMSSKKKTNTKTRAGDEAWIKEALFDDESSMSLTQSTALDTSRTADPFPIQAASAASLKDTSSGTPNHIRRLDESVSSIGTAGTDWMDGSSSSALNASSSSIYSKVRCKARIVSSAPRNKKNQPNAKTNKINPAFIHNALIAKSVMKANKLLLQQLSQKYPGKKFQLQMNLPATFRDRVVRYQGHLYVPHMQVLVSSESQQSTPQQLLVMIGLSGQSQPYYYFLPMKDANNNDHDNDEDHDEDGTVPTRILEQLEPVGELPDYVVLGIQKYRAEKQ